MTTVESFKRYISKSVIGECCHGTKAIERGDKEAFASGPDAANGKKLRPGSIGCWGRTANRVHLEKAIR